MQILVDRPDSVVALGLAARKLVRKRVTGCSEFVGEAHCVLNFFSFTGKHGQAFIHIATYTKHANMGFNHGVDLQDPQGLLEGTGKRIRHVRLTSKSHFRSKALGELISNAVSLARQTAEENGGIQPSRIGIRPRRRKLLSSNSVKRSIDGDLL
ncbi:MAG: DUF1801 domain-containing protein [Pirellulaceae bacterium]|nr:DUF1801 domain-containing protein [Pirellulaceae bacterium]